MSRRGSSGPTLTYTIPLDPCYRRDAVVTIPRDLTAAEAERISGILMTVAQATTAAAIEPSHKEDIPAWIPGMH
jgi:hypothetical protein